MKVALATLLSLTLFPALTPLAQRRDPVTINSKRLALVIGNAAYKESPLANPVNDARDMSQLLTELGFQVIYRQNASQAEMKSAIREFGNKIVKGDVALFYFAGHGAQVNGENYLIPVDAVITKEEEVEYESVNAGLALAQMASAANKLNIVILDACRNNPFARSFRSQTRGLAQISAPAGTIIAYATEPGSVAADGKGKNGLYTEELLRTMRVPGLKIEDVFKQVRVGVRNRSQGKQTPWESSSLEGDFYFNQPGDNTPKVIERVEAPVATADVSSIELKFWESVERSKDPKDFEAYLRKYPNGNFVELANNRIKSLEDAKTANPSTPANSRPTSSYTTPSDPTSSGRNEQPEMSRFKLLHHHGFLSKHEGTFSISPQKIQWAEGLIGDPKDDFGISCSDITGINVILRDGYPTGVSTISDHEHIIIDLKDKSLNQKGRKKYTLVAIDALDRKTINEVGDILKRACPGVKITASRMPVININTNDTKRQ